MKIDLRITTAVAASLLASGCDRQPKDNGWTTAQDTAVCTDKQGNRVADANCRRASYAHGGGGFGWYYLGRNARLPFLGERVGGGSYARNPAARYAFAPPATAVTRSGAISRGGFGSAARFFGGGRS
ncbi:MULTISPECIES: hypothetical protein [unclassified Sphingomonas]|jgi:hypothetical protein|uniref:hypothetical protein n=1 Tax=unclassified Sphingomonas TaxID=196159 RepID=UPI000E10B4FD|nr:MULTISPECIES: hypothetical protein [unclassified Sphingomonas]AXJ95508.1 hypothetical protein DM480_08235 [Sphingomonas sp. FARSPH]